MSVVKKEGYPYAFNSDACSSCEGRCCTGESGYIYVSKSEIFAIADLLNLSVNDFGVKFLYKNGYKYSIKEVKYTLTSEGHLGMGIGWFLTVLVGISLITYPLTGRYKTYSK